MFDQHVQPANHLRSMVEFIVLIIGMVTVYTRNIIAVCVVWFVVLLLVCRKEVVSGSCEMFFHPFRVLRVVVGAELLDQVVGFFAAILKA